MLETIGAAINKTIVNGFFIDVNPPSLKMKEGVYMIDIKSAKQPVGHLVVLTVVIIMVGQVIIIVGIIGDNSEAI